MKEPKIMDYTQGGYPRCFGNFMTTLCGVSDYGCNDSTGCKSYMDAYKKWQEYKGEFIKVYTWIPKTRYRLPDVIDVERIIYSEKNGKVTHLDLKGGNFIEYKPERGTLLITTKKELELLNIYKECSGRANADFWNFVEIYKVVKIEK